MKKLLLSSIFTYGIISCFSCYAYKNTFTSPDLDFFNLHGQVKELTLYYTGCEESGERSPFAGLFAPGSYKFNEAGEWTNPQVYRVERNDNGQIVKFITNEEPEDRINSESFTWEGKHLKEFSKYANEAIFFYTGDDITKAQINHYYTQFEMEDIITLSDFKYDNQGNWISCKWDETITYEDNVVPPLHYSGEINRYIIYRK